MCLHRSRLVAFDVSRRANFVRIPKLRAGALGVAAALMLSNAQAADSNALFAPSPLPFQAPPFDRIKDSDFGPAFDTAMKRQLAEIESIADNPAAPTFDNTIVAMERSGRMLDRVSKDFDLLTSTNTSNVLEKIEVAQAPRRAAQQDAILLNSKLFARVEAIYQKRESLHLDSESRQLLEVDYQRFLRAGARLSDADKEKLKALNKEISTLETTFEQKLLAATNAGALIVDNKDALVGLNDAELAAAARAADMRDLKGKFVLPLWHTTGQPVLQTLSNRSTREMLFSKAWIRTEGGDANDTRETVAELAAVRAQKARLLGYPNYAAYALEDQMARTPNQVDEFLGRLIPATAAEERREASDLQAVIDKEASRFDLKPWDWARYAEKVRRAKYDLDENEIEPYFELNNVLVNGAFYAANQLYGITFKELKNIPVWQSDVRVYEVFDKNGSPLGLVYFDLFRRDNKQGGDGFMNTLVNQSRLLGTKSVIYIVCNFAKPAPGQPALISFDSVTDIFHEFGHGLHALFANEKYESLSGVAVARDFVEFPSQFNEHWALYPQVLRHYAVNYKTGAPMPDALVAKIEKAATFNQGYLFGEILTAAKLDMQWHEISDSTPKPIVDDFEQKALANTGLDVTDVPARYRSSYFAHIWNGGYAAGYYGYTWCEMLDNDAFHWFMTHGGLTRANGQRFRDMILSRGHSEDYAPMFRAFYGKDPDIEPLLEHRGLAPESK